MDARGGCLWTVVVVVVLVVFHLADRIPSLSSYMQPLAGFVALASVSGGGSQQAIVSERTQRECRRFLLDLDALLCRLSGLKRATRVHL